MKVKNERRTGIILTYLQTIISIFLGIFYTPYMLNVIGKEEYGLYQVSSALISNMGLLSLGFNGAYIRFYTKSRQRGEEEAKKINGLFIIIYGMISIVALAVGVFILHNSNVLLGSKLTLEEKREAKVILFFMISSIIINFMGFTLQSYVTVKEKFVFISGLNIFITVLVPIVTIPLCYIGFGAVSIAIANFLASVINNFVYYKYCKNKIEFKVIFDRRELCRLKEMTLYTSYVFLSTIAGLINDSLDGYIIGLFWGTKFVTIYSMGVHFRTYFQLFASAISGVYTPEIHRLVIQDNRDGLNKLFSEIGRRQYIVLQICLAGFLLLGRQFLFLWLGEGYTESYYVALWILIPITIPMIQRAAIEIQRAKNKHQFRAQITLIMAVINLVFTVILCPKYGIVSCAFVTGVSYVLCNGIILNIFYYKKLGLDIKLFWKKIGHVLLSLPIPFVGICIYMYFIDTYHSWIKWICGVCIFTILYVIQIFIIELNKDEKNAIKKYFKKKLV